MKKTIIFLSGWMVPKFLSKSKLVWNYGMWADYNCIYVSSKTPTSDSMIKKELDRLEDLLRMYPEATVVGHSLGGWWAANLAVRPNVSIKKLVFWTPLADITQFTIFNASNQYAPLLIPSIINTGIHKVYCFLAQDDLIVPSPYHGQKLKDHFDAGVYVLEGGHFYQENHQAALDFMKEWIEV